MHVSINFYGKLKTIINYLSSKDWLSKVYLHDSLWLGLTVEDCSVNQVQNIKLLERLGFIVNPDKSKLVLEKRCKY